MLSNRQIARKLGLVVSAAGVALLSAGAGAALAGGGGVSPPSTTPQPGPGTGGSTDTFRRASVRPHRVFYDSGTPVRLRYVLRGSRKLTLRIDILRRTSGRVVQSFLKRNVTPGTLHTIAWYGNTSKGDLAQKGGYRFRITKRDGTTADAPKGSSFGFRFYRYVFPVRGSHSYGDGIGAPRSGHTHQGQDVMARCGTRLVAARGGRVQYAAYQSAAGNYVVIDGRRTGVDFAYMHLRAPALVRSGHRVRTGEHIGNVGETGNAVGCHLHFEMWTPPGWYQGGHFMNPTPFLRSWDKYS